MIRGSVVSLSLLMLGISLLLPVASTADEVIVGTNSVWLKKDSTITGDVVTNDASLGATLVPGVELQIDRNTSVVGSATSDSIGTELGATASDGFFCNELDGVPCDPPLALPVFYTLPPFLTTASPLLDDVSVGVGDLESLDEGAYRDIVVEQNGTLCFTGGIYDVRSITGGRGSSFLFAARTVVKMDGKLFVGTNGTVGPDSSEVCSPGPAGTSAAGIVFYVAGANADPFEVPAAASFGGGQGPTRGVVEANVYAPNGTIRINKATDAVGAFVGRDVLSDKNNTVTVDSAFDFRNQPLTADSQEVFTEGASPLDILLTASDPEDDSLTFSILTGPTKGTLGSITPIQPDGQCSETPAVVCTDDSDCPGSETCVLPPVASALVTYTPNSALCATDPETGVVTCPEDSFDFEVEDPSGNTATATVNINPGGDPTDPPPILTLQALDATAETAAETSVVVRLEALAPDGVVVTFSIVSGPSDGALGGLTQLPPRSARVTYAPDSGFVGGDSFDFEACGLIGAVQVCDQATAVISVQSPRDPTDPTATDVNATIEMDTEVMIPLEGTPGDPGGGGESSSAPLVARHGSAGETFGANGERAGSSEGAGGGEVAVPITIGAGWSATTDVPPAFFWSGVPPVFSTEGPFTFTGDACVSVTDDFQKGDQFNVYDNGQLIGTTPLVDVDTLSPEVGPDAAYADPTYSSRSFDISDTGSHSIEIEIIPPNSFNSGRGYLRVDPPGSEFCGGPCGLTFSVETEPEFGTVGDLSQLTSTTAEILFTPNVGFAGTDFFSYGVTDCFGGFDIGLVDIIVIDSSPCQDCYTIDVTLGGAGNGDVTSNPLGISCGGQCTADFNLGTPVTLQARPVELFQFTGWGGECSGSNPIVTVDETDDMDDDGTVECTANFN